MTHSFNCIVDAVIISRGADPTWTDSSAAPSGPYTITNDGSGDHISSWHPPDSTYGTEPTQAELDAITEAEAESARTVMRVNISKQILESSSIHMAMLDAIASATGVSAVALKDDVVARMADLS